MSRTGEYTGRKLSKTQWDLLYELERAMSKHETLSPFRVINTATILCGSPTKSMPQAVAALRRYNHLRERDEQRYKEQNA